MAWLMSNAIYGCEKVPIPPNTEQINKMNCRRIEHKKAFEVEKKKHKISIDFMECNTKSEIISKNVTTNATLFRG